MLDDIRYAPTNDWLAPQPLSRAFALPAPVYCSPQWERIEHEHVFRRGWQFVAHAADVAGAGDHVVADVAGVPIIVVRGDDGVLRAFHNVCRHRAGPLATCAGRAARALQCRYHGWTYTLDGRLRSAPEMADAEAFSVNDIALPRAQIATWRGLVFVGIDPEVPLADVTADMTARTAGHALESYERRARQSYTIACNWKVYVDNFLEGYHLPHIHPGLNRLLDYRSYRTETTRWHSLQWSPLERDASFYGGGDALYYWLWPNTMLNILPGRLQTNTVVPLGTDRCRVDFEYFYPAGDDAARATQDQDFSDGVQAEDIAICESVQRALSSESYVAGRLNPKRESGVHHFHELLRATIRAAWNAPATSR
jgi:choline monooxygenase